MPLFNLALLARSGAPVGISVRLASVFAVHTSHLASAPYSDRRPLHMSASVKSPGTENVPFARRHLVSFFALYPGFSYDPKEPFMDEFWRLVDTCQFGRCGNRYKLARRGLGNAILLEFKDIYRTHSCNIHVWHKFFSAIGIDEAPRDIGLCYKRTKSIHVNICDLIDRPVTGIDIKRFPNEWELSHYTLKDPSRPKIVPRIKKELDPIVGRLFRHILNPPKPK